MFAHCGRDCFSLSMAPSTEAESDRKRHCEIGLLLVLLLPVLLLLLLLLQLLVLQLFLL